ncbi:helix-turn-helix transcriptional regulator [Saccharomonospora glauca]|uniref:Response regulator containing a CheY-like receiver domain and an HTH DNA-binding domain n=1 Tax=Saccharomonospora glauca K62 TaxID=928724 RepID=I1D3J5_9PSEU|nr:LuxR family transcriptional regulator [Saccharomonospora glauca]EIE99519.1 response regulator containing a CheY-like receiver domain and an HTH DNA-binding domain [Saccharomonospora glauca K62]
MYLSLHTARHLVSVVDTIAGITDPERFPESCLAVMCDLLASDSVVYHARDLRTGTVRHVEFHRVSAPSGDGFRPHHVTLSVTPVPTLHATVVFSRHTRPYTDVEHDVCELLREPITSVLRRLHSARLVVPDLQQTVLTLREREIVRLVALGRTNVAIAHELALSPRTVAKHLEHVYRKLRVDGRAAAVARVLG